MNKYSREVKEKYGNMKSYQEYTEKTKNYSSDKWIDLTKGMNDILQEFSLKKEEGFLSDSKEVQNLVEELQRFITENYYLCSKEILANLGKMYIEDERFRKNIDMYGEGTSEFISYAIKIYCL